VATVLTVSERTASKPSLTDGELVAAGMLLLLFVAAAASVLRLGTRMAREFPGGRFG
jgi:hypothetical protein